MAFKNRYEGLSFPEDFEGSDSESDNDYQIPVFKIVDEGNGDDPYEREELALGFKKSTRVLRTPTKQVEASGPRTMEKRKVRDNESPKEEDSKKPREDLTPSTEEALKIIGEKVKQLVSIAKISGNKELHVAASTIKEMTDHIKSCMDKAKETKRAKNTKQEGTQTMSANAERIEEIKEEIKKGVTDGKAEFFQKNWPSAVFERTELTNENIFKSKDIRTVVSIISLDELNSEIVKQTVERAPQIKEVIVENKMQHSDLYYYQTQSTIIKAGQESETNETGKTFVAFIEPHEDKQKEIDALLKIIDAVSYTKHKGETAFATSGSLQDFLRKTLEFRAQELKTKVKMQFRKEAQKAKTATTETLRKPMPRLNTIFVKGDQKSYADMAKDIKNQVDLKNLGIIPRSIKPTKNGDLKLEFTCKKNSNPGALKQTIEEKTKLQADLVLRKKEVIIKYIEPTASQEEVKKSITEVIGAVENITLYMPEPRRDQAKFAIVSLPKLLAEKLIDRGKIIIGLSRCKIEEKITPPRCFRCQKFGHIGRQCKEATNNLNMCMNCGTKGHRAGECKNQSHCYECKADGHRAGSMKCPKYREIVRSTIKENRSKPAK